MTQTGITEKRWRSQPFAVWVHGEVVKFTETRAEADRVLAADLERLRRKAALTVEKVRA